MAVGIESNSPKIPIRIMPPAMLSRPETRLVKAVAIIKPRYNKGNSGAGVFEGLFSRLLNDDKNELIEYNVSRLGMILP